MKNLIEGMTTIIMLSIISFMLLTIILSESVLIKNRNIYLRKYEDALVNGEENKYVEHLFEFNMPFIGGNVQYKISGYTR